MNSIVDDGPATFRKLPTTGIIEQFDPISKRLVLRAQVEVFSGEQVFEYANPTFWTIIINGLPIAELPDVSNARVQINAQARTIKITTR